jgi:hypothetical protein
MSGTIPPAFPESLAAFLKREGAKPAPRTLVASLVPADGVTLLHGQPRSGKTLAALELALAMATGTPAFGMARFHVERPVKVCYLTEEDSPGRVSERLRALVAGRKVTAVPPMFVAVRQGVSLDEERWQRDLTMAVERAKIEFVWLDPLRSMTSCVDQGPAELQPFTQFLRRLQRRTGVAIGLVHHDTKLRSKTRDFLPSPHQASGGGLFSIADAPIHCVRNREAYRVEPSLYKFSDDPPPFAWTLRSGENGCMWLRLDGHENPHEGETAGLQDDVLNHVRAHPGQSGRDIARALGRNRDRVTEALGKLEGEGRIEKRSGPRKAQLWTACKATDAP